MNKNKVSSRRRKILIFLVPLTVIIMLSLLIFQHRLNPDQKSLKDNLKIEVGDCSEAGPDIQKINSVKGEYDNLIINTTISPNCSATRIIGDYDILDENLTIKYKGEHKLFESGETACICPMEVTFIINNLDKKEYDIDLKYDTNL